MYIRLSRRVRIPDPVKSALYARSPDLGPRILFFSGGTALKDVSRELIHFTHNSIHVITPFDSGGSSAKLRRAFHMPAIGDVRNRLMALADRSLHGNPEIFELFAYRLSQTDPRRALSNELEQMIRGRHPLVSRIPDPMRKIIRRHLQLFRDSMPVDFDLAGASIGNLILTAGYLENRRRFDTVIFIFSKLVRVLGTVRPVVNRDVHLAAELEDGNILVGQHLLTGKEAPPISSAIRGVFLSDGCGETGPLEVPLRTKMKELIAQAELICYPMGSFYSSLIANLLPKGVGRAVSRNPCPKVFIPNLGHDPELYGLDLSEQVRILSNTLIQDDPDRISLRDVLNLVIVDDRHDAYPGGVDREKLRGLGVQILSCPLVGEAGTPLIDEKLLVPVLLSLT